MSPLFGPKIGEDRKTKKKGHCRQIRGFSAQKCKVQNKKKKRSLPLNWLVFGPNENGKKFFTTNQ